MFKTDPFLGITNNWVLTPQKERNSHIFKMAIFSKFSGGDSWAKQLGEMQMEVWKYVTFFLNFSGATITRSWSVTALVYKPRI